MRHSTMRKEGLHNKWVENSIDYSHYHLHWFISWNCHCQPSPAQPSLAVPASHREHKANFLLLSAALIKNLSGIDLWKLFVSFVETWVPAQSRLVRHSPAQPSPAQPSPAHLLLSKYKMWGISFVNEILCPSCFQAVISGWLLRCCGRVIDAQFTLRPGCMSRPH